MPADPIVDFLAAEGINAQALVLALAGVIVVVAWGYMLWAMLRGTVRW